MSNPTLASLSEGDKVRVDNSSRAYTVIANYGHYVAVYHAVRVSNLDEWLCNRMPLSSLTDLELGDLLRSAASLNRYVVTSLHETFAIAVDTQVLTENTMWKLVAKANYTVPESV